MFLIKLSGQNPVASSSSTNLTAGKQERTVLASQAQENVVKFIKAQLNVDFFVNSGNIWLQVSSVGSSDESVAIDNKRQRTGTKSIGVTSKRYNQFCQSWLKITEFSGWLTESNNIKRGYEYALCQLRSCDITAHKNDIKRHCLSEKHIFKSKQISQNKNIKNMIFLCRCCSQESGN